MWLYYNILIIILKYEEHKQETYYLILLVKKLMQTVPADFILFIVMICRMLQAFEFKPKKDLCMFALAVANIAAFPLDPLCSVTGPEHFLLAGA